MLIKKRDIIHHLKENGFIDCYKLENVVRYINNRLYFVVCTSRSKLGWYHYFVNKENNSYIKFNMYFLTYINSDENIYQVKLNRENFNKIDEILNEFIGTERKFSGYTKLILNKK